MLRPTRELIAAERIHDAAIPVNPANVIDYFAFDVPGMCRVLATVLTLGLLSSFVFAVVLGLMLAFGATNLAVAIVLVALSNFLMLLVSPTSTTSSTRVKLSRNL